MCLSLRHLCCALTLVLGGAACSDDSEVADPDVMDLTSSSSTSTSLPPIAPSTSTSLATTARPISTWTLPSPLDPDQAMPNALPPLVVVEGDQVMILEHDGGVQFDTTPILTAEGRVAEVRMASDGTIFVEERYRDDHGNEYWPGVIAYRPDGMAEVMGPAVGLYDVAVVNDTESVIVAILPADDVDFGGLVAFDVQDVERRTGELGLEEESGFWVTHFDLASGIGVATAVAEFTEWIGYVTTDGASIDLPDVLADLVYDEPPFATAATLSADASTITWAEGPDWSGSADDSQGGFVPGDWVIRSADVGTGEERLFWTITDVDADAEEFSVQSIHDLGGHLIINRFVVDDEVVRPLQAVVIDLTTEEPDMFELPISGYAAPAATRAG